MPEMIHKGSIELEAERLLLRRFTREDNDAMYRNWANNNSETARFLCWQDGAFATINEWIANYDVPHHYCWAVILKDLAEPIGYINAHDVEDFSGSVEIGYAIGERFWHRGIASEAAKRVVRFLFEEVGVVRITAKHRPSNTRSGGVMLNVGMKCLGFRRNTQMGSTIGADFLCYEITAKEYVGATNPAH